VAVQLMYENRGKLVLFGRKKGLGLDIIPHVAGGLGNVFTYANAGFQARIGWNLPRDFGLPPLRPGGSSGVGLFDRDPARAGREFDGIYLFTALDGQLVLRNIFLDGNTFRDSHSVKKDRVTGNFQLGLGIKISYLNLSLAYVRWSRLFESQKNRQAYLITNFSYSF
jgi:lipid A 3-O-deacylase